MSIHLKCLKIGRHRSNNMRSASAVACNMSDAGSCTIGTRAVKKS